MDAKIYSVESVKLDLVNDETPELLVRAEGQVTSSGWSKGRLIPWAYIAPPEDGIQDFDFIASVPSSGFVLQVLSPIAAEAKIGLEDWVKGVRIHASSNNVEKVPESLVSSGGTLSTNQGTIILENGHGVIFTLGGSKAT